MMPVALSREVFVICHSHDLYRRCATDNSDVVQMICIDVLLLFSRSSPCGGGTIAADPSDRRSDGFY